MADDRTGLEMPGAIHRGGEPGTSRMIITAASAVFGSSLLSLLGSLDLNWPGHPRIRVYDLGIDDKTLGTLSRHGIEVVPVPPFCPHWRRHFTWKIWCWNDAPARDILWIDAGVVVLQPMDEVFEAIRRIGYFVVPTYHPLTENASGNACRGCGVPISFREGKMTLAGGLIGFRKEGGIKGVLEEALSIALVEENIASVEKMHRHDQMIISLLLYKHLGQVHISDGVVYCGWLSPNQSPGQKVWVHRRGILPEDERHFASHISTAGSVHIPRDPVASRPARTIWKKIFSPPERFIRRAIRGRLEEDGKPYDGIRDKK
jgi:hypothetical protein